MLRHGDDDNDQDKTMIIDTELICPRIRGISVQFNYHSSAPNFEDTPEF